MPTNNLAQSNFLTIFLAWFPYVIVALLLYLFYRSMLKIKEVQKKKDYYKQKVERLESDLKGKTETISKLTIANKSLDDDLKEAKVEIKFLDDYKRTEEKKQKQSITDKSIELPLIVEKIKQEPVVVPQPKVPAGVIKYARYADMGDGFSKAELLDKADNETIFELKLLPDNTGQFKIINDFDAQRYALSNAQYFLGKTCQYDSFATNTSTIFTDAPGTIKLMGNKWAITQPAKISFS